DAFEFPSKLQQLFMGNNNKENFQSLIRMYNNLVAFTSVHTNIDYSVQGQFGISVFRISGGMTH
ncbi:hypothetical protein PCASD_26334, partial [Puccinia coronata f. sp. avenae]